MCGCIPRVAMANLITRLLELPAPCSCWRVEMKKVVVLADEKIIFACGSEDCTANAASSPQPACVSMFMNSQYITTTVSVFEHVIAAHTLSLQRWLSRRFSAL